MNDWSLVSEYFSLILLAVIALFYCDATPMRGLKKRRNLYWACLGLSALSILLNIISVNIIENIHSYSTTSAMLFNTLYFIACWLMITVMVYYMVFRILEFVYDLRCLHRARLVLTITFLIFFALLLYNIPSGIIFSFDRNGEYCRGPLNAVGFVLPVAEVGMLLAFYYKHRASVGSATEKILFVAAPISLMMILYQTAYPDQLLNGALCALVNMIIFISSRGGRIDQDYLTGLGNHRCLMAELEHLTAGRQCYHLIVIKMQCLQRINRIYGQSGGDAILFQVSDALQQFAKTGHVFRCGSEEFAVLLSDADKSVREERLQNMADLMHRRWTLGEYDITISFFLIELVYTGQSWTLDDVSGYLDDAAHLALNDGLELMPFDESLVSRRQRREHILHAMNAAMHSNRFKVFFQPVYYHSTGSFESAEALLRMTDEDGTAISPTEFIPVAEETGLIDELTALVLEQTCQLLSRSDIPELKVVSINLPIREIVEDGLKTRFLSIMQKYGVTTDQIRLEITERDVVDNGNAATQAMHDLVEAGYRFMLDDFGVGYSNLSRVLAMPLDTIKLDRSLILLLGENSRHLKLMKNYVVPMFRKLGQGVVAEGVETEQMAQLVLSCDVDRIQGFYYARPMSAEDLREWYRRPAAERRAPAATA